MGLFVDIPDTALAVVLNVLVFFSVFVSFVLVAVVLKKLFSHVVKNLASDLFPNSKAQRLAAGGKRMIGSVGVVLGIWVGLERIGVPLSVYFIQLLYIPAGLTVTPPLSNWMAHFIISFEYDLKVEDIVDLSNTGGLTGSFRIVEITSQHVKMVQMEEGEKTSLASTVVFIPNRVFTQGVVVKRLRRE